MVPATFSHSRLIAPIFELLQVRYELLLRCVSFIVQCMSSYNSVLRTVSHYGAYFRHMLFHTDANAIFCCNYLDVILSQIGSVITNS